MSGRTARLRATALLLPALVPTAIVLVAGLGTVALQAFGLMPLVGEPAFSTETFTAQSDDLITATLLSLAIAASSTILAAFIGLAAALAIVANGRVVAALATLTIPIPHLIGAAAIGLLLSDAGLLARVFRMDSATWPQLVGGRWWIAVIAEFTWKESAFIALVVAAALATRVTGYSEAAAVLGAGRWQRFRLVTLPLATPALAAAAMITFVYSFGSFEVARLLGRPHPEPLPVMAVRLFSAIDLAARPNAAAAASVSVALCLVTLAAALFVLRRSSLWR
ncbi:ABC transporter permease [Hoyosella subflava]|uniref:Putative ABC-transporter transport protein n=1 Tax=Hoyosella subflava (strain DSM 45089 / JCM 17490 / NBRC 109087 / DQS3-9A1) TaxID=443218 RepID=F6EK52_HOYSD|nr:ABC transporter permease subunit [Hoyosella subflava]AEF42593.1 Putative ABC-transporter transport protein [Hoyosella subflava DQS3-9A1]